MRNKHETGFTLIELIVVMVITVILTGFVADVLFHQVATFNLVTARKEGLQNSRFASMLLTKDIRQIVSADSIFHASEDSMRFKHVNGTQIDYQHSGSNLYRNADLLLENLSGFSFSYLDDTGNALSFPIGDFSEIRVVGCGLSMLINGQSVQSNVTVTPRNF